VEKHTRIGLEYQVDLKAALTQRDTSEDDNVGTLVWDPSALPESEVTLFLAKSEKVDHSQTKGSEISFVDEQTISLPNIMNLLHHNQYSVHMALQELKKDGILWCKSKPNLSSQWTKGEVAAFVGGMRTDPKNFAEIKRKIGKTKALKEVVEFYWYWRATNDFKKWRREENARLREGTTDGLRHYISIKDPDSQRNPRLRKRPRVDYSYSSFMSKFKEQGETFGYFCWNFGIF